MGFLQTLRSFFGAGAAKEPRAEGPPKLAKGKQQKQHSQEYLSKKDTTAPHPQAKDKKP